MLTADPQFEIGFGGPALLGSHPDQFPDPLFVHRDEGILLENPGLDVVGQKLAGVVPGQRVAHLGEIVGAKGEEVGFPCDHVGRDTRPGHFDHGADTGSHPGPCELTSHFFDHGLRLAAQEREFSMMAHQWDHDFRQHLDPLGIHDAGRLGNGADLHPVDVRVRHPQATSPVTEHGVEFVKSREVRPHLGDLGPQRFGNFPDGGVALGQKFVQRRVE